MSASMPPTRAATLRSSPAAIPFCARSTTCSLMPRSLKYRSALRVSAHFLVPKSWTFTPGRLRPRGNRRHQKVDLGPRAVTPCARSRDALAAELLDERRAVQAEQLGGAVLVAAGALERLADHPLLDRLQHGAQVGAVLGQAGDRGRLRGQAARCADLRRQIGNRDEALALDDHHALDDVLELADVARPRIGLQDRHRLGLDPFDVPLVALVAALEEVL